MQVPERNLEDINRDPENAVVSRPDPPMTASEALYLFMGWLTSRDQPTTLSANHDSTIAAELVDCFCKTHGIDDPRHGFKYLIQRADYYMDAPDDQATEER